MPPGLVRGDAPEVPRASEFVVQAESLTKRFGDVVAVDSLSFELTQGTITGFLGPNGAGKTTTLRMVLGLAAPTSGRALVFGRPYGQLAEPSRRVGAVLEATDFHPGRSGRDHLRMLAEAAGLPRSRVDEVLRLVELEAAARRRVKTYSLGMRQRLGLAAALLGDPELLILDEPANGLDPAGVRWLRDFLRAFAGRAQNRPGLEPRPRRGRADRRPGADHQPRQARRRIAARRADRPHRGIRARPHTRMGRLADALSRAGIRFSGNNTHALIAYGTTSEQVGDIAFAANVPIYELTADTSSLEEAFLGLTAEQAA